MYGEGSHEEKLSLRLDMLEVCDDDDDDRCVDVNGEIYVAAIGAELNDSESRHEDVVDELESRESDRDMAVLTSAGVIFEVGDVKNIMFFVFLAFRRVDVVLSRCVVDSGWM